MALKDQSHVRTALFVKIDVKEYWNAGSYSEVILAFSDHNADKTINGVTYTALGQLMGVTSGVNELRATSNPVTISISGIPNTSIQQIVNSKLKGSRVSILRGYFNQAGNPITGVQTYVGRYNGYVNNYALVEEYNSLLGTASNTIQLECSSWIDLLNNRVAGRRTNSGSQNRFFPNDRSFDRVFGLANQEIYINKDAP